MISFKNYKYNVMKDFYLQFWQNNYSCITRVDILRIRIIDK